MIYYLIILLIVTIFFLIYKSNLEKFVPSLMGEDVNNYSGTILYKNNGKNKNKNKYIDLDKNIQNKSLNSPNVKFVDRYKDNNCEDKEYRYCYGGELKRIDIFDNTIYTNDDDTSYNYGRSYNTLNSDIVNLEDYKINATSDKHLIGSSISRDEVFYDISNCGLNRPWRFLNKCYKNESQASYSHDKKYYDNKDKVKYPYDKEPTNPNNSLYYKSNKHKVLYEKKIWTLHNRPVETIEYNLEKCTHQNPYLWEGKCYDNRFVSTNCNITNNNEEKNIPCLELKYLGKENLYNSVTNNFIGDLSYGDYSHFICDNSGVLTECISNHKIIKNEKNIKIENIETKTYDHILNNNVLYNDVNKKSTFVKEHYIETNPHSFYENYNKNFINGYNENILPNETSFFIECKTNYNEGGDSPCPKHLPICEGNINRIQSGVCKSGMDTLEKVGVYNVNAISCNKDIECPYNFPLCKDNICTHNTIKKRVNSTGVLNDKFNHTI